VRLAEQLARARAGCPVASEFFVRDACRADRRAIGIAKFVQGISICPARAGLQSR
jgi:hypothetical protein